jgi:hypothetical protein
MGRRSLAGQYPRLAFSVIELALARRFFPGELLCQSMQNGPAGSPGIPINARRGAGFPPVRQEKVARAENQQRSLFDQNLTEPARREMPLMSAAEASA